MGLIRIGSRSAGGRALLGWVILLLGLVVVLVGCGGAAPDTTTSTSVVTTQVVDAQGTGSSVTAPVGVSEGGATDNSSTHVVGAKSEEEYKEAIPQLEEKLKAAPDDLATLQELAIAQYNTEQYQAAAQTYEKMLSISDQPMTRNNFANVLRDWGRTAEAKAEYQKAIAADPTLTVAYVNLATVLVREGNKDEAIELLGRGIEQTQGSDQERLQAYKDQLSKAE